MLITEVNVATPWLQGFQERILFRLLLLRFALLLFDIDRPQEVQRRVGLLDPLLVRSVEVVELLQLLEDGQETVFVVLSVVLEFTIPPHEVDGVNVLGDGHVLDCSEFFGLFVDGGDFIGQVWILVLQRLFVL